MISLLVRTARSRKDDGGVTSQITVVTERESQDTGPPGCKEWSSKWMQSCITPWQLAWKQSLTMHEIYLRDVWLISCENSRLLKREVDVRVGLGTETLCCFVGRENGWGWLHGWLSGCGWRGQTGRERRGLKKRLCQCWNSCGGDPLPVSGTVVMKLDYTAWLLICISFWGTPWPAGTLPVCAPLNAAPYPWHLQT